MSPFLFLPLAVISLIGGLWAGLIRLAWPLPLPVWSLPSSHGPLMLVGFLGTLISLERAVALERRWPYGAPLLSGLAGLLLLAGMPRELASLLSVAAGLFFLFISVALYQRQASFSVTIMGWGALLWLVGNLLWHWGYPLYRVVPWWVGFLSVTIAGERWELSRLLRRSALSQGGFLVANGLFILGLGVSLFAFDAGLRLGGMGLGLLALWLFRYDIAWRTVRHPGLPRFAAACLLSGYFWLGAGALLWLIFPALFNAGPVYDAMLHAVFLGFVFSMIFGHAPMIFPSLTGVAMPFQKAFYAHLILLHLSLLWRIGSGLVGRADGQAWGGLFNVLAIILFLGNTIRAVRLGKAKL